MNIDDLELLSPVPKAAKTLSVTPGAVRKWIRERKFATVHLGRLVRVPRSEIERLIQLGTTPARQNSARQNSARRTRVNSRGKASAQASEQRGRAGEMTSA